jgi:hypothetical protein
VKSGGKSFIKNVLIWMVIGFIGIIIVNYFKINVSSFSYSTAIVTAVLVLGVVVFLTMLNMKKMRPLDSGTIIGEHEYELTDDKIIKTIGSHQSISPYDSILNLVETNDQIFLFIDKTAAYLINKNNIISEADTNEIIDLIKSKCANAI